MDSSEAKAAGEGSLDGLASLGSAAGTSDLVGADAAFEDPSKATSFNCAFITLERFQLDCKPLVENRSLGLGERRKKSLE